MKNTIFISSLMLLISCENSSTTKTETVLQNKDTALPAIISPKDTPVTAPLIADSLKISPNQEVTGAEPGSVVFKQKEKTIFYYDLINNTGEIIINGKKHVINKYSYTNGNYTLSGKQLRIVAKDGISDENAGGDCFYSNFPEVTISLGSQTLKLKDVEAQDCPKMQ